MMPRLQGTIERIEMTPGLFKRQPFQYSSNESGVKLISIQAEWPFEIEVESEGLDGIQEAVQELLDRFGGMAFDFTVSLLEKDREEPGVF